MNRGFSTVFWIVFALVFVLAIGQTIFQGYLAVTYGPRAAEAATQSLEKLPGLMESFTEKEK